MMSRTALAFLAAGLLDGATTTTWEMSSYQDFLRGKLTGLSLTRDGRLVLAPALRTLFSSEQPAIWSAAKGPDGALYLGTGHRGRVYRVEPGGALRGKNDCTTPSCRSCSRPARYFFASEGVGLEM